MDSLILFTPAGVLGQPAMLTRARRRLQAIGFDVEVDADARARHQRFAGDDDTRLAALHRVALAAPSVAIATRGGYGMTRLLDRVDWALLAKAVDAGTRWVGYSDLTALHLGLLAHTGRPSWAGPMGEDFGRTDDEGGLDDVTAGCFAEAMAGELEAVGFRTDSGFDGLQLRGTLWGGNLSMLCSLLGTPHMPPADRVRDGVLFLEDVNEHPYRVERMLLQLLQSGVLASQSALLLGDFGLVQATPLDRGYRLSSVVQYLRDRLPLPVLSGLPFGHVATKVTLPVGRVVDLEVERRDVLLSW